MIKKTIYSIFIAVTAATWLTQAQADVIGIKASADYWHYSSDSNVSDANPSISPSMKDDQTAQLSFSFEHPIPFLPNLRLKHTQIESQSDDQYNHVAQMNIDFSSTDAILYYEILDNWVNLDVGLGIKELSGDLQYFSVSNNSILPESKLIFIDHTLPVLYGSAAFELPLTSWSTNVDLMYSNFNDKKVSDVQAEIQYDIIDNLLVDVGLKLGYRYFDIEFDEQPHLNLTFKGPYLGVGVHF